MAERPQGRQNLEPACPNCKGQSITVSVPYSTCNDCDTKLRRVRVGSGGLFGARHNFIRADRSTLEVHGAPGQLTGKTLEIEEGED